MDEDSHKLFGRMLLEKVKGNTNLVEWATAPDIDLGFLHRYHRHRFSVIEQIYKEFFTTYSYSALTNPGTLIEVPTADEVLCIASHLYLDIFNGVVFPFGFWHVVKPERTVLNEVLDDFNQPKLLIKELEDLSTVSGNDFPQWFYSQSERIMREAIPDGFSVQKMTYALIERLAVLASDDKKTQQHLIDDTCIKIWKFVGTKPIVGNMDLIQFEELYAELIVRAIEESGIANES